MRRKTFDGWFRLAFAAAWRKHFCMAKLQTSGVPGYDTIEKMLVRCDMHIRADEDRRLASNQWFVAQCQRMDALEARLVQLECPKHSYKTDRCVKCGKPKEGE